MQIPTFVPPRASVAQGAARRTLIAGFGLLIAACATTSRSPERYVVLESDRFT